MTPRFQARRGRRVPAVAAGLAAAYLAIAYLLAPELWWRHEHHPGLARRPMLTATASAIPGDPINVGLVGDLAEVTGALQAAGWRPADPVTLRSSLGIGLSVLLDRPYPDAPVSPLYFEGRMQDLAFEKPVGVAADRRHHVRFWKALDTTADGRPLFLGAASFDRGVGFSHLTGQVTHHIAPDVDSERAVLMQSLTGAGRLVSDYFVPGSGPTLSGRNGGGDLYVTDGDVLIGVLTRVGPSAAPELGRPAPQPSDPWWIALRRRIWGWISATAGRLG
jgi:hypothetical protein